MKLPESWREIRLTPLLTALETGGRPSGGVGEIESGIPSISGEHFDWNGTFDFSSLKFIPHDYFTELQTGRLKKGDVLIVKDGATTAKCAFVDEGFPYEEAAVNEHIFLLRADDALLNSRFLYELLRSEYGRAQILKSYRGAAIGGIPRGFVDHIKLPLPTLPEQQRIVNVLRQAEEVSKLRSKFDDVLARIKRQLFVEMFGDPNPKHNKTWPIIKLGSAVTVATGGTPAREQTDSYGGKIAWAKSTDLTDSAISASEETLTELGVQRSNAKVYPKNTILLAMYGQGQTRGRTAKLLTEAACNQACAALLPSDALLPDYLWVWLQLSYDYVRAKGRGGQQENLNLDIVRNLSLPKPPVPLQQEFARRLEQLQTIERQGKTAQNQATAMFDALRISALTGEATETWRDQHREEIAAAAQTRDALLRERGAKLAARPPEPVLPPPREEAELTHRHWLLSELSDFQRAVLAGFLAYDGHPLLAEVPDEFDRFRESDALGQHLAAFPPSSPNPLRRTLSQLAALGLIAKVSLPRTNPTTGAREFLTAFRPLRPAEQTRAADVATLRRSLGLDANPSDEDTPA